MTTSPPTTPRPVLRAALTAALVAAACTAHGQSVTAAVPAAAAAAGTPAPARFGHGNGKLLLTGGVSTIDGAAGGGISPWAVIGGYGAENEYAASGFASRVKTGDYAMNVYGVALGVSDRAEFSLAQQRFDADAAVPGATLRLDVAGVKLRVAGDAVVDSDSWMPQVAVGALFKRVDPGTDVGGVLDSVAAHRGGVDFYLSATKLLLGEGVLLNGTLRATKANQNGLLGFGSSDQHHVKLEPEVSLAWLLRRDLAVGAEYRKKPDNLRFAGDAFRENDWYDVFVAWAPTKHISGTLAWVDLGNIVGKAHQHGAYLSLQLGY